MMRIPVSLEEALEKALSGCSPQALERAGAALSQRYRRENPRDIRLAGEDEVMAYAAYRMPATYAAVDAALGYALASLPGFAPPQTLLDAGPGPGTVMWAVCERFPELSGCTLLERDAGMRHMGQALAQDAPWMAVRQADWRQADLLGDWEAPVCDLVTTAYVLNELETGAMLALVRKLWIHTRRLLLLVEPGTPRAHARLMQVRAALLQEGAFLAAPCPHGQPCPLPPDDWCHALCRVERTAWHRAAKDGVLGYEDEKFSYLAFSRSPVVPAVCRVLRRPLLRKGLVQAKLCTPAGLEDAAITRRDKARYRAARDWQPGDGEAPGECTTE